MHSAQLATQGAGAGVWVGIAHFALSGQRLLTFLSAALLGQVLFALVKWKLSGEAETLFTFRFDRL